MGRGKPSKRQPAPPPPRPLPGGPGLGRTARLLAMRPPLWAGGHCFTILSPTVSWCVGCYQPVPMWAFDEGFVTTFLGRWCSALFLALGPGTETPPNSL